MVKSRPTAQSTGNPECEEPITPLHLLLGRASMEVSKVRFGETRGVAAAVHKGRGEAILEEMDAAALQGKDVVPHMDQGRTHCSLGQHGVAG
jgi:hypothetical protein